VQGIVNSIKDAWLPSAQKQYDNSWMPSQREDMTVDVGDCGSEQH